MQESVDFQNGIIMTTIDNTPWLIYSSAEPLKSIAWDSGLLTLARASAGECPECGEISTQVHLLQGHYPMMEPFQTTQPRDQHDELPHVDLARGTSTLPVLWVFNSDISRATFSLLVTPLLNEA